MSIVDLSGTPAVRFPDPPVPRVSPNGVQPYSAYNARLVFMQPNEKIGGTYAESVLSRLPSGGSQLYCLLFGTDYPARMEGEQAMLHPQSPTGREIPHPFTTVSPSPPIPTDFSLLYLYSSFLPPTEVLADQKPKKIVRGLTTTNGVAVSGFPIYASYDSLGLTDDSGSYAPTVIYSLRVVLNGAVIASTSLFQSYSYDEATGDYPPVARPNYPVILWEGDFTQQVVDDGFKIETVSSDLFGLATTTLDVVGLWTVPDYNPVFE